MSTSLFPSVVISCAAVPNEVIVKVAAPSVSGNVMLKRPHVSVLTFLSVPFNATSAPRTDVESSFKRTVPHTETDLVEV